MDKRLKLILTEHQRNINNIYISFGSESFEPWTTQSLVRIGIGKNFIIANRKRIYENVSLNMEKKTLNWILGTDFTWPTFSSFEFLE